MAKKLTFSKARDLLKQALPRVTKTVFPPYGAYKAVQQLKTTPSLIPSKLPSFQAFQPVETKIKPIFEKIGQGYQQLKSSPYGQVGQFLSSPKNLVSKIGQLPVMPETGLFTAEKVPFKQQVPLKEYFKPKSYLGGPAGKSLAGTIEQALPATIPMTGGTPEAGKLAFSKAAALKGAMSMGAFTAGLNALKGEKTTMSELAPSLAMGAVLGGVQPTRSIKEATAKSQTISKELEPLAKEARKYKSAEEFMKAKVKTSQEFGYAGQKYIQTDLPIKDIFKRLTENMEYRDIEGRGGLPTAGRKVTKPISVSVEDLSDLANTRVQVIDGWQRLRQAIANGDETIPVKIFTDKSQIDNLFNKINQGVKQTPKVKIKAPEETPKIGAEQTTQELETDEALIKRMTQAIKKAKPLRLEQETIYTQERGKRLAKVLSIREKEAGKAGFIAELGALKGEYPKVSFEAIEKEFTPKNVDRLFQMIDKSEKLGPWEKINAKVGLAKILERGEVPTKGELKLLNDVFGQDFTKAILEKRGIWEKIGEGLMQAYNLPKATMTPLDLSATLMQNLVFAYRHPLATLKNIPVAIKSFGSEKFYRQEMKKIGKRPTFQAMTKAGVDFTDVGEKMTAREETFMSSWAEKIPGYGKIIKASNRAYSGFLNKMRADVFDQVYNAAKRTGQENDPQFLKWAGQLVNAGTGRGDVRAFGKAAWALSRGLFSGRKLFATIWWLNPVNYVRAHPLVRKEMLKTALAVLGGGLTILGLAKANGADVEDDPTNIDFGRIRIGNTRFNIWGDFQRIAVLLTRLIKGYGTSSTSGRRFVLGEGYRPMTRMDLIQNFIEGKLDPTLSFIIGVVRGQNSLGDPFEVGVEIAERFTPMVLSDIYDLYRTQDPILATIGSVLTILGLPGQTYGEKVPVITTTPTGKQSVKLREYPKLPELLYKSLAGIPITNVPKEQWPSLIAQKEKTNWQRYLTQAQNTIKQQVETGELTPEEGERKLQDIFSGAVKAGVNPFLLTTSNKPKSFKKFKTGGRGKKVQAKTLKQVFAQVKTGAKMPKEAKKTKSTKTLRDYLEKNKKKKKQWTLADLAKLSKLS